MEKSSLFLMLITTTVISFSTTKAQTFSIFEKSGSYLVHGVLNCNQKNPVMLVGAGTMSETPVQIEPLKHACPLYHQKTIQAVLHLKSKNRPWQGSLVEKSIKRVMSQSVVIPPKPFTKEEYQ